VPSIVSRTTSALQAAIAAFRDAFSDPSRLPADFTDRQAYFRLLWSYYKNSTFDDIAAWQNYREKHTLYRNIRSIFNPTKRLVNFYVAQVYPGVLSEDGSRLPDGVQLAIPFSDDTDPNLTSAIAQFWQWSNWQSGNRLMVRYGGATGSCLVEVVDAVDRGKVSAAVRWPGLVSDLELDDVGNVRSYELEYEAEDEKGETFTYRKEVDQNSFRYFRDDKQTGEDPNIYGFVPAVWCKHVDEGADFGAPAIAGSISKIDELNGLVSHNHDQVDILIDSPGIISTDGSVGQIGQQSSSLATAQRDEYSATASLREKPTKRLLLKSPKGASWLPLVGNLQPEKVVPLMEKLISEIEHDFPELSMYQELRDMSQVTGPGAARMMGDVYSKVLEVSSNYDTQSIKLFQMVTAIGGFRFREGKEGWRLKTDAQTKFAAFNLDSYSKGDLDMAIMPRPLIPLTEADSVELMGKRLANAGLAQKVFDDDKTLEVAGISDPAERQKILTAKKKETEEAIALLPPPSSGGSDFVQ
jgi:hypothetical protein